MRETSSPQRREFGYAIGVSHLSPSTDVVFRAKPVQGQSLSPIGSPLPESSPPRFNNNNNKNQPPQRNFNIKSYNLFCSNSPDIANLINVVSPRTDTGLPKSWSGSSSSSLSIPPLASSAPTLPSVGQQEPQVYTVIGNKPFTSAAELLNGFSSPPESLRSTVKRVDQIASVSPIISRSAPMSSTGLYNVLPGSPLSKITRLDDSWSSSPPLSPTPTTTNTNCHTPTNYTHPNPHIFTGNLEDHWNEWLSSLGGMDMGRDLPNVGGNVRLPGTEHEGTRDFSIPGYAVPRSVWVDVDDDGAPYPSQYSYCVPPTPVPGGVGPHLEDGNIPAPEFVLHSRGRRHSFDTRSRSSSSGSDSLNSPHFDDEKASIHTRHHINSISPPPSPPQNSPGTPPRRNSRHYPPYPPAAQAAFANRARISTHPITRGYSPRQQQRGYGPRQPYPDSSEIPHVHSVGHASPVGVHATASGVPVDMSFNHVVRGYSHPFVNAPLPLDERIAEVAQEKSRSRSTGDAPRDKGGKSLPASPNHHYRYRHKAKTARHRHRSVNRKDEDLARFELVIKKVVSGQDTRTTLMIKNIPNKYDQEMLLEAINKNFKGSYDFFYLPIDFKNKCNVGYAFINFIKHETVTSFHEEFNQKKWEKFNSEKVCKITYARIQGKLAFIDHFRNSSLMYEDQTCRPLIFHSGGPSMGELEPFPPANVPRTRPVGSEEFVDDFNK